MTDDSSTPPNPQTETAAARLAQSASKAKEQATQVARQTVDSIEGNPLSVLVGGLALGVIAGSLLPRSAREAGVLGGVGKQLTKGASAAFQAAREAGKAELIAAGLDKTGAREQFGKLVSSIGQAAGKAAEAAKAATKKPE